MLASSKMILDSLNEWSFSSRPNAIIYGPKHNRFQRSDVIASKEGSWNEHLKTLVTKTNRILGFLKRNCSGIVDCKALNLLYILLVRSHITYCSQVWAAQSVVKDILSLESVQRRPLALLARTLSNKERLQKLNLLPLNYGL